MSRVFNLLADAGDISGTDVVSEWILWDGGPGDFAVWGDFGKGKMQLELTPDSGTTVICVTGSEIYDKGVVRFSLFHGFQIRARLSDTTSASSGIHARIFT